MTPKLLVCVPSPRDIPEVKEKWDNYSYDVLVAKYMLQLEAYTFLREYFLEHTEYTHLAWIPDDVVVNPEDLDELWSCIIENDYPVLSGMCPVDEDETRPIGIPLACQWIIPMKQGGDEYQYPREWVLKSDWDKITDDIIEIEHVGFPCMIMKREVMEKVSWRGSTRPSPNYEGNFDWQFSKDCKELGIKIRVKNGLMFKHLRNKQAKESKSNPLEKKSTHFMIFNESYYG